MKIYGDSISGNCLKIRWVADHLRLPYQWIETSVLGGGTRTPEFLARFPMGQVPAVELADGRLLAQSNAIIRYLARASALLPEGAFAQAKVDEWLFWEQYSHEPYVAVCRFHMQYLGRPKEAREAWRVERGEKALDLMEAHLADTTSAESGVARRFFAGGALTIADVALLAYTRVAHEGGFDLNPRPHTRNWIARCEAALGISM